MIHSVEPAVELPPESAALQNSVKPGGARASVLILSPAPDLSKLTHVLKRHREAGIGEVVVAHWAAAPLPAGIKARAMKTWSETEALRAHLPVANGSVLVTSGNAYLQSRALHTLQGHAADISVLVDVNRAIAVPEIPFAVCSAPPRTGASAAPICLLDIVDQVDEDRSANLGVWTRTVMLTPRGIETIMDWINRNPEGETMVELLRRMIFGGVEIEVAYTAGNWGYLPSAMFARDAVTV